MNRWILALVLALALVAAGCGGNDDESGGDAPSASTEEAEPEAPAAQDAAPAEAETETEPQAAVPEEGEPEPAEPEEAQPEETAPEEAAPEEPEPEPVVLTASYRGVAETEIKIGVGYIDASMFGINNGDLLAQWQAAIDAVNDAGGVNGRLLAPVFGSYSPVDAAEIEAVCVRLAEDEESFIYIGNVLTDGVLCYTELYGMLAINASPVAPDVFDRSGGLLFTTEATLLDNLARLIEGADAQGLINGQKVQIHVTDEEEGTLGPAQELVEAAGGVVSRGLVNDTPDGDIPAGEAQYDIFIERADADGVDTILAIGNTGYATVGAANRAGSDVAIVTGATSPVAYTDFGYDPGQANLYAFGSPTLDELYFAGEAGVAECVENYEARSGNVVNVGVPNADPFNLRPTVRACRAIDLFVAIATAAGPLLTQESFIEAAQTLGSFDMTGSTAASLGEDKSSADQSPLLLLEWDTELGDFVSAN